MHCVAGLAEIELRLREGQLQESLEKIRLQLHVKTRLIGDKQRNARGQRPNTRAITKINTNEAKIIAFAEKYRAARRARLVLEGNGEWEDEFRELVGFLRPSALKDIPDRHKLADVAMTELDRIKDDIKKRITEVSYIVVFFWNVELTDSSRTRLRESAIRWICGPPTI